MPAGIYNFTCDQGATFERVIEITNYDDSIVDLSGKTGRMQVRKDIESASALIELTTENNRMTFDSNAGSITLLISAADTAALQFSGIYDLEVVSSDGTVDRVLQGIFDLDENVTT
ncbi:MAG: hypothetical protein CL489_09965 [Acidobacteria bacterium]|nr:hypothetical protein [Acidobacteriota bacterium]